MLGGSSSTRSPFRAPSWSGTWLGSALGHALWLSAHTCELARSSLSMRRYRSCALSWALPKQPATADSLLQAGWRSDLVLQMAWERDQPALAELPVSLRQPQDIRPPSASPLLADNDPSGSTGVSVASQEQLRHLVSPGRLAFCSAPLPDLRAIVRMPKATSYQELQTCLQRTLVA